MACIQVEMTRLRPSKILIVDGFYGDDGQVIISARQSRFGTQASRGDEAGGRR